MPSAIACFLIARARQKGSPSHSELDPGLGGCTKHNETTRFGRVGGGAVLWGGAGSSNKVGPGSQPKKANT